MGRKIEESINYFINISEGFAELHKIAFALQRSLALSLAFSEGSKLKGLES